MLVHTCSHHEFDVHPKFSFAACFSRWISSSPGGFFPPWQRWCGHWSLCDPTDAAVVRLVGGAMGLSQTVTKTFFNVWIHRLLKTSSWRNVEMNPKFIDDIWGCVLKILKTSFKKLWWTGGLVFSTWYLQSTPSWIPELLGGEKSLVHSCVIILICDPWPFPVLLLDSERSEIILRVASGKQTTNVTNVTHFDTKMVFFPVKNIYHVRKILKPKTHQLIGSTFFREAGHTLELMPEWKSGEPKWGKFWKGDKTVDE